MERARLDNTQSELASLVAAAKKGDESALPRLIELTEERLYRFLMFLSADAQLANDLAQDVYLYVFENIKKVESPDAFLSWLFRIGRSKFLDFKKSPRNRPHAGVEALDGMDTSSSPDQRELVLQVRQAFGTLDADDRLVLVLCDIEGYTVKEASEFMGISEAAGTSRLRRARAAFHKKYFEADKK